VGFYNEDLIKKAGLTSPPSTWAQFKELAVGLKKADPGAVAVIAPDDTWFQDEMVLDLVGQTDPNFYNNVRYHNGKWDTPQYVAALAEYKSLYTQGIFSSDTLDVPYADAVTLFDTGKAAVMFNGTWEDGLLSPAYRAANKVTASEVGLIPVPATNPANDSVRSFLDIIEGIPKSSTHQAAAAKFIQFETAGDGIKAWIPSLSEVPDVKNWKLPNGILKTAVERASYAEALKLIANPHSDRNIMNAFAAQTGGYVLDVVEGRMTPAQAAAQGQSDLESGKYS
jgi:raffinose/stachyose/melibiose transport system substrate-binding protein